jgi:hypothetical protein
MKNRDTKTRIPDGQPRPYPRIKRMPNDTTGSEHVSFVYPHQVVNVRSKQALIEALEHYSHPAPLMDSSEHMKSKDGMRYMVEWAFPALRWFCKVYGNPVPSWLKGNGFADGMNDKDYKKHFGTEPLSVKEWTEDKAVAGQR